MRLRRILVGRSFLSFAIIHLSHRRGVRACSDLCCTVPCGEAMQGHPYPLFSISPHSISISIPIAIGAYVSSKVSSGSGVRACSVRGRWVIRIASASAETWGSESLGRGKEFRGLDVGASVGLGSSEWMI
ncbi:hypothetical protein B0J11DRAFT_128837 [Dendryphion nanum]|uniref:Secreted protein n=1 Tax=Dendryphion nanum TaxID=256645 RepID=A0A9P9D9P6_9PLEO|nr:hypothetical protein B0J11DRAFT_128837 [Dendryphion nanum]